MKMYQLVCPSCGANVEIEEGRKSCFCSYCGNKIYLDDEVKRVEITKHTIYTDEARIKEIEANERIFRMKNELEIEYQKQKNRQKRLNTLKSCIGVAFYVLIIVACFGLFGSWFSNEKRESDQQERALEAIVEEVLNDIENHEFESAKMKAETIQYTEGWSDDLEKKWDDIRKNLLRNIKDAEKEWKKENKNRDTWWNPFD